MVRTIAPAAKRAALLDAAEQLFSNRTYGATAVPDLAQAAGVATGSVYRHFANKEALANAVFQRSKRAMFEHLVAHRGAAMTPREEFDQWWNGLAAFAHEQPGAFSFLETQRHEPYLDEASRALSAEIDAAAADFVVRAQAAGAVRAGSPDIVVAFVFGAFVGLFKLAEQRGAALTPVEVEFARESAWNAIATPPQEGPQ